ncbi:MAG: isochorismatase hydrolase [Myxococcales bacterium]|nr:isochorismatase hydrolase [Myxococcales bacterium]
MTATASLVLDPADTCLVIVDCQVKLSNAMPNEPLGRAVRNWIALVEMAARIKLPVCASEQYPQGLGGTLPVLKEALMKVMPPTRWLEKLDFSCCETPLFQQFLANGRRTFIVCGMETHVCVYQTVRAMVARGLRVHVPVDACLSRAKHNWRVGIDLMERTGAVVTSTETVLFDLVKRAEGEHFRALTKLVK